MNREEYLKYRNEKSPLPLYEFYKEHHKTGVLLDVGDFFQAMSQWPPSMQMFGYVITYYDAKFVIMTVSNVKTGQIYRYL
jgi:hypothetical protein